MTAKAPNFKLISTSNEVVLFAINDQGIYRPFALKKIIPNSLK